MRKNPISDQLLRTLYETYRFSYGIRESVKRVAADENLQPNEVCQRLGLEPRFANPSPLLPR